MALFLGAEVLCQIKDNIYLLFEVYPSYYCYITNHPKCSGLSNYQSAIWAVFSEEGLSLFHVVLAGVGP